MSSFDRLTYPDRPESYGPQPGTFPAAVVGRIVAINDPKGRGWVQVTAPIIDPLSPIPNGDDDWIPVAEQFTVNGAPGGSHRPLQIGVQVVVHPLYPGDGKNWYVADCLPCSVDPPSPETNRSQGTTGVVSREGIIDVTDHTTQSHLSAYPHGVTDLISGQEGSRGDRLLQTSGGATVKMGHQGDVHMENPKGTTHITQDGDVISASAGGATTQLSEDGTVNVISGFGTQLQLLAGRTDLTGPLSEISGVIQLVNESLRGHLGKVQDWLKVLGQVSSQLGVNLSIEGAIAQAEKVLNSIESDFLPQLDKGIEAITQLKQVSPRELSALLAPQLLKLEPIAPILSQVESILKKAQPGLEILDQMEGIIPADWTRAIQSQNSRLAEVLDGLSYDPRLQLEAILDEVLPDGFGSVENLFGLGVAASLPDLRATLSAPPPDPSIGDILTVIADRVQAVFQALPPELRQLLEFADVEAIVANPGEDDPVQLLLGLIQSRLAVETDRSLQAVGRTAHAIAPIQAIVQDFRNGTDTPERTQSAVQQLAQTQGFESAESLDQGDSETLLKSVLGSYASTLQQQSQSALGNVNALANALPAENSGAMLRLTQAVGELTDPMRLNSIYAGLSGVGARSPWGEFSFGGLGGSFFSQGVMNFLSQQGGLLLKKGGEIALAALSGVERDQESGQYSYQESVRVRIADNSVFLESANGEHQMQITDDGIYLNSGNIYVQGEGLADYVDRLAGLRLTASSPAPAPSPAP